VIFLQQADLQRAKNVEKQNFLSIADCERRPHAGCNSPKITLYGWQNYDYTENWPSVSSLLLLPERIKSPRLAVSNSIRFLAK